MREDMFKVIVERPRWGSRHAPRSKLRFDKCADRSHVTGRRLAFEVGYTKQLNENLAPLVRYLNKQVSRRWNDVFSEICEHLDTGSTVKMHVRQHLDDFVDRQVHRGAGGCLWTTHRWRGIVKLVDSRRELYVDPDDGVLKKTREYCKQHGVPFARNRWAQERQVQNREEKRIRKIDALNWHVQLNGIWYFLQLSNLPLSKDGSPLSDASLFAELQELKWREHERWNLVLKQQLSGKQLKAFGLSNRHDDMEVCYASH